MAINLSTQSVAPSTLTAGLSGEQVAVTVKVGGVLNYNDTQTVNLSVVVYLMRGSSTVTYRSKVFSGEAFTYSSIGTTRQYVVPFLVPQNTSPGSYSIKVALSGISYLNGQSMGNVTFGVSQAFPVTVVSGDSGGGGGGGDSGDGNGDTPGVRGRARWFPGKFLGSMGQMSKYVSYGADTKIRVMPRRAIWQNPGDSLSGDNWVEVTNGTDKTITLVVDVTYTNENKVTYEHIIQPGGKHHSGPSIDQKSKVFRVTRTKRESQ